MVTPASFGPYRVLHQIGSGVLGPVFRCFDPQHSCVVAVKAIQSDLLPEPAAELAGALSQLCATQPDAAGLIRLLDAGLESSTPFLVMECVTGDSLDVVMRRLGPAQIGLALSLVDDMAQAMDAAHDAGWTHGALHPRDVLVDSATHSVRMTGWGMSAATRLVKLEGPVRRAYVAPEWRGASNPGAAADRFALSVMAHELIKGRRPSGVTEAVWTRALARAPEARFPTARAFVEVLRESISPVPTAAGMTGEVDPPAPESAAAAAAPVRISRPPEDAGPWQMFEPAAPQIPAVESPAAPRAARRWPVWFPAVAAAAAVLVTAYWMTAGWLRSTSAPAPGDTEVALVASPEPARPPVPQPPPPVEAAPDPRGRMRITSSPVGALVTLNGEVVGVTPAVVDDLTLGSHTVRIARPDFVPVTRVMTLSQDRPDRALDVALRPAVDARATSGARATPPPRAPAPVEGAIHVESRPRGALVMVNGRLVGTAPLRLAEVTPGRHSVSIELAGFQRETRAVTVRAGQTARVVVDLQPGRASGPAR